jgi:hypothetical protein
LALYGFQAPPRRTRRSAFAGGLSKLSSVPDDVCHRGARSTF